MSKDGDMGPGFLDEELDKRYDERIKNSASAMTAYIAARPKDSFAFAVQPHENFPLSFGLETPGSEGHSETAGNVLKELNNCGHSYSSMHAAFFAALTASAATRPVTFQRNGDKATLTLGATLG